VPTCSMPDRLKDFYAEEGSPAITPSSKYVDAFVSLTGSLGWGLGSFGGIAMWVREGARVGCTNYRNVRSDGEKKKCALL
jgi:hypothetical protein